MQTRFTIKPEPLKLIESTEEPQFKVTGVHIATKLGHREFDVNPDRMSTPHTECWFYVLFEFPWKINTGAKDSDAIITDGTDYYLVNTSLYSPKRRNNRIIFSELARKVLDDGITNFLKGFL